MLKRSLACFLAAATCVWPVSAEPARAVAATRVQAPAARLALPQLPVRDTFPKADGPPARAFEQALERLSAASTIPGDEAPAAAAKSQAQSDFARRIGETDGPRASEPMPASAEGSQPADPAGWPIAAAPAANPSPHVGRDGSLPLAVPAPRAQRRSAFFPMALALVCSAVAAAFFSLESLPGAHGVAALAAFAAAGAAGVLAAASLLDAAVFVAAMARGRRVTDEQFRAFIRREVSARRLDAGVAELIEVYRPEHRLRNLTFGLVTGESIYLRPELAATPWLFRVVLIHELHHLRHHRERGPPQERTIRGFIRHVLAELGARGSEIKGRQALQNPGISTLERALRQAQYSLKLEQPYDVLVVNPTAEELKNPAVYGALSGGKARIETVSTRAPQDVLGQGANAKRFRAVVLDRPSQALPEAGSQEAKRLARALEQLDALHVLATRGRPIDEVVGEDLADPARFRDLAGRAQSLDRANKKAVETFEKEIRDYWRQVASSKLKGLALMRTIDGLYDSLRDRGLAVLNFIAEDDGVVVWERLLRYWQAEDGGRFRLVRVDLEEGGHVLVLRKTEARVGLWLKPRKGGLIPASVINAHSSPEKRDAARRALEEAGFKEELARFDELGVQVNQVFGADVGRQEIYVTVPRRRASAMRRFVSGSSIEVLPSQAGFELHLPDVGPIHKLPALWRLGLTGKGGSLMVIDTGGDAAHPDFGGRLEQISMLDGEGAEDWVGHGTHVLGIAVSGDGVFTGMARAASAIVAKVFGRDSAGAADGPIMGAATLAFQRGIPVISASFGSRGNSGDNLAIFLSHLTEIRNERGQSPTIVASAGNAGPFDSSLSQPAVGTGVIAVAAAAKSLDDGRPEIAFYSSVGPDLDPRFAIPRLRLKPDITAIGGDVTTRPESPRAYELGVGSAKSRFAPAGREDTPDGLHKRLSGTSMAAPVIAALALLLRLALRLEPVSQFVLDHMPASVKAILLRSAADMGVPLWFQGAGLADAEALVRLILPWAGAGVRKALSRLPGLGALAPRPGADPWDWIERYAAVQDIEDQVYKKAELAKTESLARFEEAAEDAETPAEGRVAVGDAAYAQMVKSFNAARAAALPALLKALDRRQEPVWLVRRQAALALLNFKTADSTLALADAALNDPDARVRQAALLALAEVPGRAADVLLQKAAADARWDVGLYAAYALARHGDRSAVPRIVAEAANPDKAARHSAIWLLGQLGARVSSVEAQALSAKVADQAERGNLRHFAAAALANVAGANPAAMTDRVITDLLRCAGPQNLALTRTIAKVFPVALRSKALGERLRAQPLRETATSFVLANRAAVGKPGGLGELVALLARFLDVALDAPTPIPDGDGLGVPGIDGDLGPLDLIVEPPDGDGATPRLDPAVLARFGAALKAALPLSGAAWVSVPEHKHYALIVELKRLGFQTRSPRPLFAASSAPAAAAAGLELDPAADGLPVLEGRDLSLVKIRPSQPVSEARVLSLLETVAAAAGDPLARPVIVELGVSAALPRSSDDGLSRLVNQLMLRNIGVVVPAGNQGPGEGTLAAPAVAGLPVVVAAAGPGADLQFYSSRASAGESLISWTERLDDAGRGTGAAAERSAEKMAELARAMAQAMVAQGGRLPDGYFFYLASLVRQALEPMPGRGAHEVGGGLFADATRARRLLDDKLAAPADVAREAEGIVRDVADGWRRRRATTRARCAGR